MDWEKISEEKEDYTMDTEEEGELKFTVLRGWREELIFGEIDSPYDKSPDLVTKIVAKFSLIKYKNEKLDYKKYKKNGRVFSEINLNFKKEELKKFANLFLENNPYIIGEGKDAEETEAISELKEDNWPNDPIKKLYNAWCNYYDLQKEWLRKTLGIEVDSRLSGTSEALKNEKRLQEIKVKYSKLKDDTVLENGIEDVEAEANAAIIKTPELLEELIETELEINKSNINNLKLSNQYLDELSEDIRRQLKFTKKGVEISKKDSENAKAYSKTAITLSFLTLFASIIFSFCQIKTSKNTTEVLQGEMNEIKMEISDTNHNRELENLNRNIEKNLDVLSEYREESLNNTELKELNNNLNELNQLLKEPDSE